MNNWTRNNVQIGEVKQSFPIGRGEHFERHQIAIPNVDKKRALNEATDYANQLWKRIPYQCIPMLSNREIGTTKMRLHGT